MPRKRDKPVDWADIEKDYRAGVLSVREIARWNNVDEKAIRKKAAALGWERVQQPGHVKREQVARHVEPDEIVPPATAAKPEEISDRGRAIAKRLMDELETVTAHVGELEDMICTEESDPRRRQALLKSLSLSERSTTLKNLSTALKTLNEAGAAAAGGKKAERQQAADQVAGKFGVRRMPTLVVDNRK